MPVIVAIHGGNKGLVLWECCPHFSPVCDPAFLPNASTNFLSLIPQQDKFEIMPSKLIALSPYSSLLHNLHNKQLPLFTWVWWAVTMLFLNVQLSRDFNQHFASSSNMNYNMFLLISCSLRLMRHKTTGNWCILVRGLSGVWFSL